MLATTCEIHPRMFRSYFKGNLNDSAIVSFQLYPKSRDIGVHLMTTLDKPSQVACEARNLILLQHPFRKHLARTGKIVDPQWINTNLLQKWKRSCKCQHRQGQLSAMASRLAPTRPIWLIDTWRQCLTHGDNAAPYVALSYIWGQERFFNTTKENVVDLQTDLALSDSHRRLGVPKTIEDAISVVKLLKERYLWVDALCIVQDDEAAKHDQINNMAAIFANASVTIIAGDGKDANYGLRGLRGTSKPRDCPQDIFELRRGYQIVQAMEQGTLHGPRCLWSSRGWTYQEDLFSRRKLIFSENRVQWRCECSSFDEDQVDMYPHSDPRDPFKTNRGSSTFSNPYPDLQGYAQLVAEYNRRDLSYAGDAMPAFAGIITALSPIFYGGFICGLPALFLDSALCWQSYGYCQRRRASKTSSSTKHALPSWSWVGWKGLLNSSSWNGGGDYIFDPSSEDTCPHRRIIRTVQWHSRESIGSTPIPINAPKKLHEAKFSSFSVGQDLGWSRHLRPPHLRNHLGVPYPRYLFMHESLDPKAKFWYPIPLCDSDQPVAQKYHSLLSCRTRKTSLFRLAGKLSTTNVSFRSISLSVRDAQGNWVGVLQPNEALQPREEVFLQEPNLQVSLSFRVHVKCELVAISRGYAYEGAPRLSAMDEWEAEERPRTTQGAKYEYYNVLWVEWKEEIAYRRGVGRIMRAAWEAQKLEWVDLIMG